MAKQDLSRVAFLIALSLRVKVATFIYSHAQVTQPAASSAPTDQSREVRAMLRATQDVKLLLQLVALLLALALRLSSAQVNTSADAANKSEVVHVHVLEKCCSFATKFEIGDFKTPESGSGWRLALLFQAFKYTVDRATRVRRTCFEVSSIATTGPISQRLKRVDGFTVEDHVVPRRFCVADDKPPTVNDEGVKDFLFYGVNEFGNVSIIARDQSDIDMSERGWVQFKRAHIYFRPISSHAWTSSQDMALIKSVYVVQQKRGLLEICNRGAQVVDGDYNAGVDEDPSVTLCVEYAEPQASSGHEVVADDAPDKTYVSSFQWLELAYKVKKPRRPGGMEPVKGMKDAIVKFSGYGTTYFELCLAKNRVLVDGGMRISDANFLKRISVDTTQDRPSRVIIEQHLPIDWLALGEELDEKTVNAFFG